MMQMNRRTHPLDNYCQAIVDCEDKMKRLTNTLNEQFTESAHLEKAIKKNMKRLGYLT